MDPRQTLSRSVSSIIPQGSYNPNMATAYSMPYHQQQPHLPPIQSHHQPLPTSSQSYVPQPYRPELPRYQSQPNPAPAPERYNASPHVSSQALSGLPSSSMLPQPSHQYSASSNFPPTSSAGQGFPQRIAPAPPRADTNSFPPNFTQPDNRPQIWSAAEPSHDTLVDHSRDQSRTHVVGSQGRRGILPSVPGRAAVDANTMNGSANNATIPAKDADGKFPCPNCNKTYLHAKHLKRHLLRHTGDRPYMCVLCKDTFSRSDILKRHFQKCSVRRGNPTGASHLSSPAAHIKKSQPVATTKSSTDSLGPSMNTTTGIGSNSYTSTAIGNGTMSSNSSNFSEAPQMPYQMANAAANDLQRPPQQQAYQQGAQNTMGPGPTGPWSMNNTRSNPMLYQSSSASPDHFSGNNADEKRNVMANSHTAGDEWGPMFHPANNDGYMNSMFPASMGGGYDSMHAHADVKKEYDPHAGGPNGYYMPPAGLGAEAEGIPPRAAK